MRGSSFRKHAIFRFCQVWKTCTAGHSSISNPLKQHKHPEGLGEANPQDVAGVEGFAVGHQH